jgi:hypothetical protein
MLRTRSVEISRVEWRQDRPKPLGEAQDAQEASRIMGEDLRQRGREGGVFYLRCFASRGNVGRGRPIEERVVMGTPEEIERATRTIFGGSAGVEEVAGEGD